MNKDESAITRTNLERLLLKSPPSPGAALRAWGSYGAAKRAVSFDGAVGRAVVASVGAAGRARLPQHGTAVCLG